MKDSKNISGLNNLETSKNWALNPDDEPYKKVYWLSKKDEKVVVDGVTYEVRRDNEGVAPFEDANEGAQAVLLQNGKPKHNNYSKGKRYFTIAELPNNEAVIAFLPAMNII